MNKLIFGDIEVSKKIFYESKEGIKLKDVIVENIVVSNKIKVNDEINKVFIGYIINDNVIPLVLLLPVMSGWIKYFENGGNNMSFKTEDDRMYIKYNSIWDKIKKLLGGIKLSSNVIYDDQYIKTKVKTFKTIKTLFSDDIIPEERVESECISCISVDSLLKIEKKWYPQVYSEQCKYKVKERKIKNLIDYDLDSDSDPEE